MISKEEDKLDPIVENVRQKLLERSQTGLNKYGVGLDRLDYTRLQWLIHAQEEALDLANYLEVLIQQEGGTRMTAHNHEVNWMELHLMGVELERSRDQKHWVDILVEEPIAGDGWYYRRKR